MDKLGENGQRRQNGADAEEFDDILMRRFRQDANLLLEISNIEIVLFQPLHCNVLSIEQAKEDIYNLASPFHLIL